MRAWISLAVLAAVVAALGVWVYQRPDPTQPAQSYALSELKPADVARIRVEREAPAEPPADAKAANQSDDAAKGPAPIVPIVLERKDGRWLVTEPFPARADPVQVERLLSILDVRASARYPAKDLARYGLDKPQAKLTLQDQTYAFGAVNTTTREQYVLTRDAVYPIALAQRTALPRDAAAVMSRALFDMNEIPVRLEGPGFGAALAEGAWTITPAPEGTSADERNAWADAWRNATAVQAARYDGRPAAENVTVTLKDGRTVTLGILQREPELVLARADEGVQYHFFEQTAKRLLAPPKPKSP